MQRPHRCQGLEDEQVQRPLENFLPRFAHALLLVFNKTLTDLLLNVNKNDGGREAISGIESLDSELLPTSPAGSTGQRNTRTKPFS